MKKRSIVLALCLLIGMIFLLSGCGGSGGGTTNDPTVGKWKVAGAEMMGIMVSGEEVGDFVLEFKDSGKGTATIDGSNGNFSWKREDNKVLIDMDGEKLEGSIQDDAILTCDDFMGMGLKVYFVKEGANVDMSQFKTTTFE